MHGIEKDQKIEDPKTIDEHSLGMQCLNKHNVADDAIIGYLCVATILPHDDHVVTWQKQQS
jgi:hypothetical protein